MVIFMVLGILDGGIKVISIEEGTKPSSKIRNIEARAISSGDYDAVRTLSTTVSDTDISRLLLPSLLSSNLRDIEDDTCKKCGGELVEVNAVKFEGRNLYECKSCSEREWIRFK